MRTKTLKGFTLIEMLVVIAIIGVLAAILVPSMIGYVKEARAAKLTTNSRSIYSAAQITITDRISNGDSVPAGVIFIGQNSGIATGSDGSTFSIEKNLPRDFTGNYGFKINETGTGIEVAVWSDNVTLSSGDVKIYPYNVILGNADAHAHYANGVGSYPYS